MGLGFGHCTVEPQSRYFSHFPSPPPNFETWHVRKVCLVIQLCNDFIKSNFHPLMSNYYITILRNSHFHQQCTPQALTNIRVFYKPAGFWKTGHPAEGGQRPQAAGSCCYLPTLANCCLFFSSTQCLSTTQVLEVSRSSSSYSLIPNPQSGLW